MRGNAYQSPAHGAYPAPSDHINGGRAGGRGFRKGRPGKGLKGEDLSPRDRMRAVYVAMSKEHRHANRPSMQRDGFMHLDDILDTQAMADLRATGDDIRRIVRGGGGNAKKRFDLRLMEDGETTAIRAAQ